jgi:drug/metabolite transporter (DMT)-like permease
MSSKTDYLKYIGAMLIFGTNGALVSQIPLTSAQIVLTRTFLGSLFLLAWVVSRHQLNLKASLQGNRWPVLIAGFALGANWIFLFEAYRAASVSVATLIYYGGPILVMTLSPFIFKEALTWNKLAAIAVVILGMFCITGLINGFLTSILGSSASAAGAAVDAKAAGGAISGSTAISVRGLVCGVMAALLYATLIIANKFIRSASGINLTILQLLIAFGVVLFYLLWQGRFPFALPGGRSLFCILLLGIINTGAAYWLYFSSMQHLSGQSVALCSYIDPVSTLGFSALFLDERLTPLQVAGAICVITGALLGELKFSAGRKVPHM